MESGPLSDPAAWLALGREHVREARAGTLRDDHDEVITFPSDIASWPDPWIAAELLTHDLGTDREINVDMVIDARHVLAVKPVGDPAKLLASAEAAKGAERIAALEAAWRACFAPELADAIEALDAANPVAAIKEPKKKADLEIAWAKAAATLSPKSAFAGTWPSKWKDAQRRMRVLYQRPRSPLLAAAAVGFARQDAVPYTSIASQKFWQALAWFIAEQGDVRQLAALEEIERRVATFHGRKELPATEALRAFTPKPLAESAAAKLGKLAVAKPAKLAALSLASAEERAVAADQLQQTGDPRGELIIVQERIAAGPPTPELLKRQAQLVKKYAKTWCPPSVYRGTCVFRSGVPVAGHLSFRSDSELRSFIGSKALATFETLIIDGSNVMGDIEDQTIVDVIRSLPALRCVITTDEAGELLASGPPTAIEHLGVVGRHGRVLAGPGLPKLRRLDAEELRPTWFKAKWFEALAEVGCTKPAEWDECWRSGVHAPAFVLTDLSVLHSQAASGESPWELVAKAGVIAARPIVGSTSDSLAVTLELVPSWKAVAALHVPANFIDAVARFAKAKKLIVEATPAVEPAQLGISLDLV